MRIGGAGPGETETFLNDTGAELRAAAIGVAALPRRSGRAIRPSSRRIAVTLTTIVLAAARRPRRKRERSPPFFDPATSRFLSGARSAR